MPASRPWIVQPYRPIARIEENLWTVDGDIRVPGGVLPRKMALLKCDDGRIAIHSPIALDDADMAAIESWGEPAYCIVPNGYHRLDAPAFRQRYPALKMLCPDAVRARVGRVINVDGDLAKLPRSIECRPLAMVSGEAAFISRSGERLTLIFGDALFNLPRLTGVFGFVLNLIGSTGGPRVTPMAKLIAVSDRKLLASQLTELAALPGLTRLVPGHGKNIEDEAPAILRAVAGNI
jgi:hypothetical protein